MKRAISLLLCLLLLGSFAACGEKNTGTTPANTPATAPANTDAAGTGTDSDTTAAPATNAAAPTVRAEQLSVFPAEQAANIDSFVAAHNSFYYRDKNNMYGMLTAADGKLVAASYILLKFLPAVNSTVDYYAVSTVPAEERSPDGNAVGLVDMNGKELLEESYASFRVLNERFIMTYQITGETDDKDAALIYADDSSIISFGPSDDSTLYTGEWKVFDTQAMAFVPNLTGTTPPAMDASGDKIKCNGTCYKADGEAFDCSNLFPDGSYESYQNSNGFTLYAADGTVLKNLGNDRINRLYQLDGKKYYTLSTSADDENAYQLLDEAMAPASALLKTSFTMCGELLSVYEDGSYSLYNRDGTKLRNDTFEVADYNETLRCYILKTEDAYTILNSGFTQVATIAKDDDCHLMEDDLLFEDADDRYFTIRSGSYSLTGDLYGLQNLLIRKAENNNYGLLEAWNDTEVLPCKYYTLNYLDEGYCLGTTPEGALELYAIHYDFQAALKAT